MTAGDVSDGVGRGERSQATDRMVALLTALADGAPHPVADLAHEVGVSRSAIYRMVNSLVDHGWVSQDDAGAVRLGVGVLRLGAGVLPMVRAVAAPVLRQVADSVGATAHLTVAEGAMTRALVVAEPTWTDWHVAYRVGSSHPIARGAAGKAIVAARSGHARLVRTVGELQPGAVGVAMAVSVPGLEASVGVVALGDLAVSEVGQVVTEAAALVARKLR